MTSRKTTITEEKPAVKVSNESAAEILKRIKYRKNKLEAVDAQANTLRNNLCLDVYLWVETVVATQKVKTESQAVDFLAGMIKKSRSTTFHWYLRGRLMRQHSLDAESVVPHAVRALVGAENKVPRADYLRALSLAKQGRSGGDVGRVLRKGEMKSGHASARRERRLRKSSGWNKTTLKMELLVFAEMCARFFKQDIELGVCDKDGQVLLNITAQPGESAGK